MEGFDGVFSVNIFHNNQLGWFYRIRITVHVRSFFLIIYRRKNERTGTCSLPQKASAVSGMAERTKIDVHEIPMRYP